MGFKGRGPRAVPASGQLVCWGPQWQPEPLFGVPPALTLGPSPCRQGEASQHPAAGGCVCDPQGVLHLPGAVSVGLGSQDSSGLYLLCPLQPGKAPFLDPCGPGSLCLAQPAPWCRQLPEYFCPTPHPAHAGLRGWCPSGPRGGRCLTGSWTRATTRSETRATWCGRSWRPWPTCTHSRSCTGTSR